LLFYTWVNDGKIFNEDFSVFLSSENFADTRQTRDAQSRVALLLIRSLWVSMRLWMAW
jgi:hypothetical protein